MGKRVLRVRSQVRILYGGITGTGFVSVPVVPPDAETLPSFVERNSKELTATRAVPEFRFFLGMNMVRGWKCQNTRSDPGPLARGNVRQCQVGPFPRRIPSTQ